MVHFWGNKKHKAVPALQDTALSLMWCLRLEGQLQAQLLGPA
jgi:hypothetical protein